MRTISPLLLPLYHPVRDRQGQWVLFPYWFNGVIDEIRIYNRALPPQAINKLINLTD